MEQQQVQKTKEDGTNRLELPPNCQHFKIYTSGSSSNFDDGGYDWLMVSSKLKAHENLDNDPAAVRINLPASDSSDAYPSRNELVLRPKDVIRQNLSDSSSAFGVNTDLSKSVSGTITMSESDDSMTIFSNMLDDLTHYARTRDYREESTIESESALSPAEEALLSMEMCSDTQASLYGMGIYYPSDTDFHKVDEPDNSTIWEKLSQFLKAFIQGPTQKTFASLKTYLESVYGDIVPIVQSHKFQVAVILAVVAFVAAAKVMDRRRVRNPLPIAKLVRPYLTDAQLESIYKAVRNGL